MCLLYAFSDLTWRISQDQVLGNAYNYSFVGKSILEIWGRNQNGSRDQKLANKDLFIIISLLNWIMFFFFSPMTMGWHRELDLNLMVRHLKVNEHVVSFIPLINSGICDMENPGSLPQPVVVVFPTSLFWHFMPLWMSSRSVIGQRMFRLRFSHFSSIFRLPIWLSAVW